VGTSGSYSGGGGAAGSELRDGVSDWLDSLPSTPTATGSEDAPSAPDGENGQAPPRLRPDAVIPVIGLFGRRRSGSADGPGAGGGVSTGGRERGTGGRGGARRSVAQSARVAGRAAAASYAYATGDSATLLELGLDYEALRASGASRLAVARRIVEVACESPSDGTIEDEERRTVAANVALWVLEESEGGVPPEPDEIARYALAEILFEAMSSETAAMIRRGEHPAWATQEGERQLHEAADALAQTAGLSPTGATTGEFERAIEEGMGTLRSMWSGS
jgi:hypothetical protein